jgi:hypothetical protein
VGILAGGLADLLLALTVVVASGGAVRTARAIRGFSSSYLAQPTPIGRIILGPSGTGGRLCGAGRAGLRCLAATTIAALSLPGQ